MIYVSLFHDAALSYLTMYLNANFPLWFAFLFSTPSDGVICALTLYVRQASVLDHEKDIF